MLYLLFLLILSPLGAAEFFSSDGLGSPGAAVEGVGSAPWVLEKEGGQRTLYKDGELYKSWISSYIEEKGEIVHREEYYFGEDLRTVSFMDGRGVLIRERLYDSKGDFMIENRFSYEDGRLSVIEQIDDKGEVLITRSLSYRSDGSLRSLKAGNDEGVDWRAACFSERFLDSLYIEDDKGSSDFRYEKGRLKSLTENRDGAMAEQTVYFYGSDGSPVKEVYHDFSEDSRRVRYLDEDGNILVQNIYKNDILEKTRTSVYEGGRLVSTDEQASHSRMRWEYDYIGDEDEPSVTRQYINGLLVKKSERLEQGVRETLYRQGEPVLVRTKEDEP